jgi:hypothetical protein
MNFIKVELGQVVTFQTYVYIQEVLGLNLEGGHKISRLRYFVVLCIPPGKSEVNISVRLRQIYIIITAKHNKFIIN